MAMVKDLQIQLLLLGLAFLLLNRKHLCTTNDFRFRRAAVAQDAAVVLVAQVAPVPRAFCSACCELLGRY